MVDSKTFESSLVRLVDFYNLTKKNVIHSDFFHVENNWLRNLQFSHTFIHFLKLFNTSYLKNRDILYLPFILKFFREMPSLNRNEKIASLECGKEYTRLHASRHRRTYGAFKCLNCNFYTYRIEELTKHFKKKHCQHKVKLCAQQSPNTLQEKVK